MKYLLSILLLVFWLHPLHADPVATNTINTIRAGKGMPAIAYSDRLEKVARSHARDMMKKGFFSHKGSNGSTVGKRAKRAGYRWCLVAENIAKGQKDIKTVMESWRTSPSHYQNLVRKGIREFAVAHEGDVWVMVLGARKC